MERKVRRKQVIYGILILNIPFSFFFSFNWNVDKVTSLITYEYFKTNYSRSNDNIKEPTSSNALSISSTMAIPKKEKEIIKVD